VLKGRGWVGRRGEPACEALRKDMSAEAMSQKKVMGRHRHSSRWQEQNKKKKRKKKREVTKRGNVTSWSFRETERYHWFVNKFMKGGTKRGQLDSVLDREES